MKRIRCVFTAATFAGLLVLAGCGSRSSPSASGTTGETRTPEPPQAKEPVLYTGQEAFTRMMGNARRWTVDAVPVHLESELTSEANGQGGKSAVWRAYVASPSRNKVKTFVCSGSRLPDAPPWGVSWASIDRPLIAQFAALVFEPLLFKIDSDRAYSVALQHGGAALLKKNPKQPVTYVLEWNPKDRVLIWHVIFGPKLADAKGVGAINATTGIFIWAK